jgi:hypothetical protein
VVGLVTEKFHGFARELLEQRNAGGLPLAVVAHPVGGIDRLEAGGRITQQVMDAVVAALQEDPAP